MIDLLRCDIVERLRERMRQSQSEGDKTRREIRNRCPHHYRSKNIWAINLVHNFPDLLPRGVCMLCNEWIHPQQWVAGGPKRMQVQLAHPLYQVVMAIEMADHAILYLRDVQIAAVDETLGFPDRYHLIWQIEDAIARAGQEIVNQLWNDTSKFRSL